MNSLIASSDSVKIEQKKEETLEIPAAAGVLVLVSGVGLMILLPIIFYPFAKGLFLAFHLYFQPKGDTDR